MVTSVFIDILQ